MNQLPNELTLRDYMSIHATQPGIMEIVKIAGLTFSDNKVWDSPDHYIGTFDNWFNTLSLNKMLDLCSRAKYAQADSMLRVRGENL